HSVLAVVFQRNLNQPETWMVGVSTYLALTFSTLLSSQGTDASFVLTLSGFPPGASLRYFVFRLYQTLSRPISSVPFRFERRVSASLFPFGGSDSIRGISPA
ncbi:hypothetical protein, partial [Streptomyces sp. SID8014]|uniref:hypothetical protein n=1 Tax=Streptomyces sp. SID8014 TaxID=2706097 RepID=UPI001945A4B5